MHECRDKIKNGAVVRLRHVKTQKNLHSHLHRSPLSGNQEVSAFGEGGGDSGEQTARGGRERDWRHHAGDDWKVVAKNGGDYWKRGAAVRLQHVITQRRGGSVFDVVCVCVCVLCRWIRNAIWRRMHVISLVIPYVWCC